jgi:hypothetical protein
VNKIRFTWVFFLLMTMVGLLLVMPVDAQAHPELGITPTPEPSPSPTLEPSATPTPEPPPPPTSEPPVPPTSEPSMSPTPEPLPPLLPETGIEQAFGLFLFLLGGAFLGVSVSLRLLARLNK